MAVTSGNIRFTCQYAKADFADRTEPRTTIPCLNGADVPSIFAGMRPGGRWAPVPVASSAGEDAPSVCRSMPSPPGSPVSAIRFLKVPGDRFRRYCPSLSVMRGRNFASAPLRLRRSIIETCVGTGNAIHWMRHESIVAFRLSGRSPLPTSCSPYTPQGHCSSLGFDRTFDCYPERLPIDSLVCHPFHLL